MPKELSIKSQNFRVQDLEGLDHFYRAVLGMRKIRDTSDEASFSFPHHGCDLTFRKADGLPFEAHPNDFYWKIGITLRDLDAAVTYLRAEGLNVPAPVQFRDIGYMSKIVDPNGFIIELLQQGFEGNAKPAPDGHPFGAQATLAHITLRVTDISSAKNFFADTLGMRLMSVQPVKEHEFCLYFYSWSKESLPNPDLEAVENREWLWARPYTFIELQHLQAADATVHKTASTHSGFDGFSFGGGSSSDVQVITASDLENLR